MIEPAKLLVVALIAAVGLAPFANARHELTVRHVRCAEHGELTHIRAIDPLVLEPSRQLASVEGEGADAVDGHDHCSSGFLVRGRMHVSVVRSLVRFTPPPAVTREVREIAVSPGRAFVLASAPKTSPPSA
ncbi:MAG: hypothetical protein JWM82_3517 [Myxococcales bacterium]|nr:hypothetical protein [Myxococcales bacterium]